MSGGRIRISTAGAGLPNGRGRPWQDRWLVGQNERGGWMVLADGIGGGRHGDRAALTAVQVAGQVLAGTTLDEYAVTAAVGLAHTAVRPWFERDSGGTTLSVVTVTATRSIAATVGDSPVLGVRGGAAVQLSPRLSGPLEHWIGSPEPVVPWLGSWPVGAWELMLVCSDGVLADGVGLANRGGLVDGVGHATGAGGGDPHGWVEELLARHRAPNQDDATVLAMQLDEVTAGLLTGLEGKPEAGAHPEDRVGAPSRRDLDQRASR